MKYAIDFYNSQNFKGADLIAQIKNYDLNVHKDITSYLQKNDVTDFNTLPVAKIKLLTSKQFQVSIDQKDFVITLIDKDFFKISHKDKFSILSHKDNMSKWMDSLKTLNLDKTSFHWMSLFIEDAHAIPYILVFAVVAVLAAVYVYFKTGSLGLENAISNGVKSCNEIKDAMNSEKDDTKIRHAHKNLKLKYQDQCSKGSTSKICVQAQSLVECMDGYLNPERQQGDASRASKPNEQTSDAGTSAGTAPR
jgi:hypothetical protein